MSDKLTTLEIVRGRLANGRTIADSDVHKLVAEIDQLREALREISANEDKHNMWWAARVARAALGEDRA